GLVGDEDVAVLELADELHALDHPHRAGGDFLANAAASDKDRAALLKFEDLDDVHIFARLHGLRPRLKDEQFARVAILGPLDVHRRRTALLRRVMVFDDASLAGELED